MHYRKQIRNAMQQALIGQTAAGSNVFTSRSRPILEILQKRELVLSVYTADERSQRDGTGYLLERDLMVSIEGMAGGGDDLDDVLDDLADEVEAVVNADPTLGNLLADDLVLESTSVEISARGNMQVGAFRLDFATKYQTQRQVAGYLPADDPGVVVPTPPVPTEITVQSTPTPVAYVRPLDDGTPIPADEINETLNDDVTLKPSQPVAPIDSVCSDGSCDLPEWGGDK